MLLTNMISRDDVLSDAVNKCMEELYKYVQPEVSWEDFIKQNKEWKEGDPKLYEFYYLDQKIQNEIMENYSHAYRIPPELVSNIECIKNYFNEPIRDKYIKEEGKPGYRGYEKFTPLKEIIGEDNYKKVEEYLDEAGKFYKWDRDLQSFNFTIALGASPNINKQAVINNWKKYRNKDIEIKDIDFDEFCDMYY